jgi:hypothetical protein
LPPGLKMSVSNNHFTEVYRGLTSRNWQYKDFQIKDNIITMIAGNNGGQYGISSESNIGFSPLGHNIFNNKVTGPVTTFTLQKPKYIAIYLKMCQRQNVDCNTVSATDYGIQFAGDNRPARFVKNKMSSHLYGYVLSNTGMIGIQGNSPFTSDNQWLNKPWPSGTYNTATIASSALLSPLYIRTAERYNPESSSITIGTGTPYAQANGSLIQVPFPQPLLPICLELSTTDNPSGLGILETIAKDLLPIFEYIPQTKIIEQLRLFSILERDPALLDQSPVLKKFYYEQVSGNFKIISEIEKDLSKGELKTALEKASNMIPRNSIESNYKEFYTVYVKQFFGALNASDEKTLSNLAFGCAFSDGEVVYKARAMYSRVFDKAVYFDDDCVKDGAKRSASESPILSAVHAPDILLYPNPNSGDFYVAAFGMQTSLLHTKVFDIIGKLIYERDVNLVEGAVNLSLDLDNGAYIMEFTSTESPEKTIRKIIIQK